jgi:hypothetical protein
MNDNLVNLLLYVAIAVIGVVATAIKNSQKKQQQSTMSPKPRIPQFNRAYPENDTRQEIETIFDLINMREVKRNTGEYDTVESGPTVEEAGMYVDTPEASAELSGMNAEDIRTAPDQIPAEESLEEGQSDIQKMIARYEAIRNNLDNYNIGDDIAAGEIRSPESEEERELSTAGTIQYFDLRNAIIYSEILKRREF